jgi:hypothetical protein
MARILPFSDINTCVFYLLDTKYIAYIDCNHKLCISEKSRTNPPIYFSSNLDKFGYLLNTITPSLSKYNPSVEILSLIDKLVSIYPASQDIVNYIIERTDYLPSSYVYSNGLIIKCIPQEMGEASLTTPLGLELCKIDPEDMSSIYEKMTILEYLSMDIKEVMEMDKHYHSEEYYLSYPPYQLLEKINNKKARSLFMRILYLQYPLLSDINNNHNSIHHSFSSYY